MQLKIGAAVTFLFATVCAASIPARADDPKARVDALVAQVPQAGGAFYGDPRGAVLHMPSGLLCELDPLFERHLARLSVVDEAPFGTVSSCHYAFNDRAKDGTVAPVEGVEVVISVARATPQTAETLGDVLEAAFLQAHPDWRKEKPPAGFKGYAGHDAEKFKAERLYFEHKVDRHNIQTSCIQFGVVGDWMLRMQVTGPDEPTSLQCFSLGWYWGEAGARMVMMAGIKQRQAVPEAAPQGRN